MGEGDRPGRSTSAVHCRQTDAEVGWRCGELRLKGSGGRAKVEQFHNVLGGVVSDIEESGDDISGRRVSGGSG